MFFLLRGCSLNFLWTEFVVSHNIFRIYRPTHSEIQPNENRKKWFWSIIFLTTLGVLLWIRVLYTVLFSQYWLNAKHKHNSPSDLDVLYSYYFTICFILPYYFLKTKQLRKFQAPLKPQLGFMASNSWTELYQSLGKVHKSRTFKDIIKFILNGLLHCFGNDFNHHISLYIE